MARHAGSPRSPDQPRPRATDPEALPTREEPSSHNPNSEANTRPEALTPVEVTTPSTNCRRSPRAGRPRGHAPETAALQNARDGAEDLGGSVDPRRPRLLGAGRAGRCAAIRRRCGRSSRSYACVRAYAIDSRRSLLYTVSRMRCSSKSAFAFVHEIASHGPAETPVRRPTARGNNKCC